jgi:hypothetical protein
MFNFFRNFHRIQRLAWGLFYQSPAYAIGLDTLSVNKDLLIVLSKALAIAKNISTAAMLC